MSNMTVNVQKNVSLHDFIEDHESYKEVQSSIDNKQITLCIECLETNFIDLGKRRFNCSKCGVNQSA
jgi:ribosomal protein S27AE